MPQNEAAKQASDFQFLDRLKEAEATAEEIVTQAHEDADRIKASTRSENADRMQKTRARASASRREKIKTAEGKADQIVRQAEEEAGREARTISKMADGREEHIIRAIAERIVEKHAHR